MVKKKILSAMAAAFVAVQLLGTTVITAQASTITGAVSTDNLSGVLTCRHWICWKIWEHIIMRKIRRVMQ